MSQLNEMHLHAREYLVVDVKVAPERNGGPISANQYFKILVSVENTAPPATSTSGSIVFSGVKVQINGSLFAHINRDFRGEHLNFDTYSLSPPVLLPGQTGSVSVALKAVKNMGGRSAVLETVASIQVGADVSYQSTRTIEAERKSLQHPII